MSELANYQHRGARALVLLHDKHLRQCVQVWKKAKASGVVLPETDDTDYKSVETLLRHTLGAARDYMVWICEKLGLPDPEIDLPPEFETIEAEADAYLEHLLERWPLPLVEITEERLIEEYKSNWGETFTIKGMLEHAVMHPIRHEFQLHNLIAQISET